MFIDSKKVDIVGRDCVLIELKGGDSGDCGVNQKSVKFSFHTLSLYKEINGWGIKKIFDTCAHA